MPKATFHNLPDDKRERFVRVARDEFAAHPYDQASVSRIVRELGIAKGSVYQYFDGKLDLFGFLVETASQHKLAWFAGLDVPEGDWWGRLRTAYREGLRWFRAEPAWNRVALRLLEPSSDPGFVALQAGHRARVHAALEAMLQQGVDVGAVREDLDLVVTARLMHGLLSEGLMQAFLVALDTDLPTFVRDPGQFDDAAVERSLAAADIALDVFMHGIAPP